MSRHTCAIVGAIVSVLTACSVFGGLDELDNNTGDVGDTGGAGGNDGGKCLPGGDCSACDTCVAFCGCSAPDTFQVCVTGCTATGGSAGTGGSAPDAQSDGSAGADCGNVGAGGSTDNVCESCMQTNCNAEWDGCINDCSCYALVACLGACNGTQACVDTCSTAHAGGKEPLQKLITCMQAQCPAECGAG